MTCHPKPAWQRIGHLIIDRAYQLSGELVTQLLAKGSRVSLFSLSAATSSSSLTPSLVSSIPSVFARFLTSLAAARVHVVNRHRIRA